MRAFQENVKQFAAVARDMPIALNNALLGWLMRAHSPLEGVPEVVCSTCRPRYQPWPCKPYEDAKASLRPLPSSATTGDAGADDAPTAEVGQP